MVPHRAKAGLFGRSSILFRPHSPRNERESLVESPGTAPGSEPIITGAFIAIVGVAPDTAQYRGSGAGGARVPARARTSGFGGEGNQGVGLRALRDLLGSGHVGQISGHRPVPISQETHPWDGHRPFGPAGQRQGRGRWFALNETTPRHGIMPGGTVWDERLRWPFTGALFRDHLCRPFRRGGQTKGLPILRHCGEGIGAEPSDDAGLTQSPLRSSPARRLWSNEASAASGR